MTIFLYDARVTHDPLDSETLPQMGRYTLHSKIGEGGSAHVYQAELCGPFGFTKQVALKVIKPRKEQGITDRQIEAFIREARLGGLLNHPNIVNVYELGEDNGRRFIAMELLDGWALNTLLKKTGPLPLSIALQVCQDICSALDAAHSLRVNGAPAMVVHRDLKPANVMLDRFGTVRVLDFGIALLKTDRSADQSVHGTLAYMAPEQILNKEPDGRTDIFSLAAMLYEMVTGIRLFRGTPPELVRDRMQVDKFIEAPEIWAPIDKLCSPLKPVIRRCLHKNMSKRFPDVAELLRHLRDIEQSLPDRLHLTDWARSQHQEKLKKEDETASRSIQTPTWSSRLAENPNNLPRPTSTFFGRKDFLKRLSKRVAETGTVTLLGLGGMGKTRLAIETGWRMIDRIPGGVWFCDLVDVQTNEGLLATISEALREVQPMGDLPPHSLKLGQVIGERGRILLILDNAEHVHHQLANLLEEWEELTPQATFLITSRIPLQLPSEDLWRVGSLTGDEAESLFRDRSVRVLTNDEPGLAELVKQLDGMALAIELAARRTSLFSPQQLLDRLDQRFQLLRESKLHLDTDRHSALTVVLDSTWESLQSWEKDALAQCAVFRGGFRLEDAENILDLREYPEAPWVVDVIQNLIDKSLLNTQKEGNTQRLSLLVSVGAYASQKLAKQNSRSVRDVAYRHAARYARYGQDAFLESLKVKGGSALTNELYTEVENLVVATQRAIAANWKHFAVECGLATLYIWQRRAPFGIALELTEQLLALKLTRHERMRLLEIHGAVLNEAGQPKRALKAFQNGLTLARRLGTKKAEVQFLNRTAHLYKKVERRQDALRLFSQSLAICQDNDFQVRVGPILAALGQWHHFEGNLKEAHQYYQEALTRAREVGHQPNLANTLSLFGCFLQEQGFMKDTQPYFDEALSIYTEMGDLKGTGIVLNQLVVLATERGLYDEAYDHCQKALTLAQQAGERTRQAKVLSNLGNLLLEQHLFDDALAHFQRALSLSRNLNQHRLEGVSLANIAIVQSEIGKLDDAMNNFIESLDLLEAAGDQRLEGVVLGRLGVLHAKRNDIRQSRKTFDLAEKRLQDRNERFQLSLLFALRGTTELEAGYPKHAQTFLERAEGLSEDLNLTDDSEVHRLLESLRQSLSETRS